MCVEGVTTALLGISKSSATLGRHFSSLQLAEQRDQRPGVGMVTSPCPFYRGPEDSPGKSTKKIAQQ